MKSKILKILGLALLILITFVWAAPYLFKGKITSIVRARINRDLRAHINFSDVNISLIRHFPKIAVELDNLQVTCVGEFDGDTLISAKQFDIACNIGSFISGDTMNINSITVNEPRVHALIHKDGHCNWDILKAVNSPGEYTEPSVRPLKFDIQRYAIHNGWLDYRDESRDAHVEIVNLEHEGRGNFTADLFTLKTKTTADAIHINFGGAIPYQVTAKTSIEMAFRVDNKTHTYSFKTDRVSFNDLKLRTEGFFQWINDSSYNMNIKFNAPSTEFKNILSMLPSVYQNDFASIKSSGEVIFNGFVKGKYDEKHFPAYHVNLDIEKGFFQYPDLPMPVENFNLALHVDNPDGIADHLNVFVPRGHLEINNDAIDFHLFVRNPKTKPFIDLAFAGKLDLANVSKSLKLEPGSRLYGVLNADMYAKGNISEIEKKKKDQFQAGGSFNLTNFLYISKAYPGGIGLENLLMTFNSKNVLINELKGVYLSTHINATGAFNNLFAFAIQNEPLNASIHLKADDLNLKDWMGMGKDTAAETTAVHSISPFAIPDNIDFSINVEADKLHYDNLDLQNLSCNMLISDETVQLNNLKADGLDGTLTINGTYSTKESRKNPEIALSYNVEGLDVQKTFFAFNTAQKIMPVGKFISGKLSSQMNLNGRLNNDMTTDLQSLYGEGNISVSDGSMKDFGPLDKLSQSLDIVDLKDIPLKDIKADFSFNGSKVVVSPFIVSAKGIEMEISGTHGFDQSLDYGIKLKVPRTQLGSKGNTFVKDVVTQAADKGIPIKLKDAITMNVKMSGTINNPDVKTDMNTVVDNASTDLKKEVDDFVNAKLDSAKQQLHNPEVLAKKQLFVQATYKSKSHLKSKKNHRSAHKDLVHTKSKKKQKSARKYYSTSLKKAKSIASNSGK